MKNTKIKIKCVGEGTNLLYLLCLISNTMPQLEQSSLQPSTDLQHRHLLQTSSYNHLLLLHLLISRKGKLKQQQARTPPPPPPSLLRSQKGLRPFNPLHNRQQGQEYLTKPIEEWPISKEITITELPETKKVVCNVTAEPVETLISRMDIERFSKFTRLINTTARIMKLYRRYKRNDEKPAFELPPDYISPKDFEQAERAWVIEAQRGLKNHVNARKYQRI